MPLRHYQRLIDCCEPYLITRESCVQDMDLTPLGIPVPAGNIFDPRRVASRDFLNLIKHLDQLTYGPIGLSMPSWVFYDCAVMPGAIFGFARWARDVQPWFRKALAVPKDYEGLVPMSLLIVIPTVRRDVRLAYSLCSVNQVGPGAAPEGLWRLTLCAGTKALGIAQIVGVTQWRSPHLGLFAGLGPCRLLTAWTPAHDNPSTVTFAVQTDDAARERLLQGVLVGPDGIHRYMDADDSEAMQRLQREIEAGLEVAVVGPAESRGSETRVPLQVSSGEVPVALDPDDAFIRRYQG